MFKYAGTPSQLMQKRLVLLILLLCTAASAQVLYDRPYDSVYPAVSSDQVGNKTIQRFSDFPLDNIHILRLQDASLALGANVSLMGNDLRGYEAEQSRVQLEQGRELSQLRNSFDTFERSVLAQLGAMQNSMTEIKAGTENRPELQVPAATFPPYVIILLGLNVFLLVLVIILIFWLREQYYVHRETHTTEHIHPAPKELIEFVKHQLSHDKKLPEIRMELAGKGWTPSIIEHALHAAREK